VQSRRNEVTWWRARTTPAYRFGMSIRILTLRTIALASLAAALLPETGASQDPAADDWRATRGQLEQRAQALERSAASPAYGERLRASARSQLAVVRHRLSAGDFRLGERILVDIQGQTVSVLDTLTVQDSLIVAIPNIRRVRLHGVLRSELEELMTREVGAVVLNAVVRAQPLMRLAVFGQVANPGYVSVPADTRVDQLITIAGGPTVGADIANVRLARGDTVLVDSKAISIAIAEGRALSTLALRDGDALILPESPPPWNRESTLQIISMFLMPIITIVLIQ
jgi:protein involved in polysaccharide export with SLBB domain